MNTATKKKLGVAAAALVLTGALIGTSATAANAYGAKHTVIGISSVAPKAKAAVSVLATYIKPGAKLSVTVAGHTYTAVAGSKATATVKFSAPSLAGKYPVKVVTPETSVNSAITVGTVLSGISEKASAAKKGKSFTLSGALSSTVKAASKSKIPVVITYKVGKKSYKVTVKTSSKGTYSTKLKISSKGTFKIKVTTAHTSTYTSVSKTISVKVK